jgi:hypothetical protein
MIPGLAGSPVNSARNEIWKSRCNSLKRNKDIPSEKWKEINGYSAYTVISASMKFTNKNKFQYGMPAYINSYKIEISMGWA